MVVPIDVQIDCVRREISMRERVYGRWVAEKRMTQKKADAELLYMRAVQQTLEEVAAKERLL